jgi:hypothetical protein
MGENSHQDIANWPMRTDPRTGTISLQQEMRLLHLLRIPAAEYHEYSTGIATLL